jgi:hypothetical protein
VVLRLCCLASLCAYLVAALGRLRWRHCRLGRGRSAYRADWLSWNERAALACAPAVIIAYAENSALLAAGAWRIAVFPRVKAVVAAPRPDAANRALAVLGARRLVSLRVHAFAAGRITVLARVALAVAATRLWRHFAHAPLVARADIAFRVLAYLSGRIALLAGIKPAVAALLLRRLRALAACIAHAWSAFWRHAVGPRRIALLARVKALVAALLRRQDKTPAGAIANARLACGSHASAARRIAFLKEIHSPVAALCRRNDLNAARALVRHVCARSEAVFLAIVFPCLDCAFHAEALPDHRTRAYLLALHVHAFIKYLSRTVLRKARDTDERQRRVRILRPVIAIDADTEKLDQELRHCCDRVHAGQQQENNEQHAQFLHEITSLDNEAIVRYLKLIKRNASQVSRRAPLNLYTHIPSSCLR